MVSFIQEFSIPFDILDAAILRCLGYMTSGVVEFSRNQLTDASAVYFISQDQLGKLGEIKIDKLSEELTQLDFSESRDADPFTPEQKRKFLNSKEEPIQRMGRLFVEGLENHELPKQRTEHFDKVVDGLLQRLEKERIWSSEQNKITSTQATEKKRIEKRGQSKYSKEEMLNALYDWDALDKTGVSLREFLDSRFAGYVPRPTFHSWRRKFKESGDYKRS